MKVLTLSATVWLAKWSRQSKEEQQRTSYITVLVLLTLATMVVSFFRDVVTFASLVKVCTNAPAVEKQDEDWPLSHPMAVGLPRFGSVCPDRLSSSRD